jgi:pimeloyl-ACP methyl ester carboxylesterase
MVDLGRGEPIVIVPGLQGRWEWKRPAVEALARRNRVIAYSLCDERRSTFPFDPARGFENYVIQLRAVLDRAGLERATLMGVSYGGLIAAEFAARFPGRVSRLVMVSALSLPWAPDRRARFYLRAPRLLFPLFALTAPIRTAPEIRSALPGLGDRFELAVRSAWKFLGTPVSPSRMARRLVWLEAHRFADHSRIDVPMLLLTGEPELDRVVPVATTRRYLIGRPSARHVVLPRSGHLGVITMPELFAKTVAEFVAEGGLDDHQKGVAPTTIDAPAPIDVEATPSWGRLNRPKLS